MFIFSPCLGEPYLLAAVQSELFLVGLRSSSLKEVVSSEKKSILSVDYDLQEQRVFFINPNADSIKWSSLDQKNKGTIIKGWSIVYIFHVHVNDVCGMCVALAIFFFW